MHKNLRWQCKIKMYFEIKHQLRTKEQFHIGWVFCLIVNCNDIKRQVGGTVHLVTDPGEETSYSADMHQIVSITETCFFSLNFTIIVLQPKLSKN
jgi:hypothetical protein